MPSVGMANWKPHREDFVLPLAPLVPGASPLSSVMEELSDLKLYHLSCFLFSSFTSVYAFLINSVLQNPKDGYCGPFSI